MIKYIEILIKLVGSGMRKDGSSLTPGTMFHPIPFPEYKNIPVHKTQCIEELKVIKEWYDFKDKIVLEIGSAGGYFTFNIAKEARYVHAIEADPDVYSVTKAIVEEKKIDNIAFEYGRFNEYSLAQLEHFDVCIMMNVHMWIVKQMGWDKTKDLMKQLSKKCDTIFFQTAHAESAGMYIVKELISGWGISQYLDNCGFDKNECIYTSYHDGKPRFLFKGERKL